MGHSSEGYAVKTGVPPGARDQGFSFTLETPDRIFLLSSQSESDRTQWMSILQRVIDKRVAPHDENGKYFENLYELKYTLLVF